jgi:uncharacterized protein
MNIDFHTHLLDREWLPKDWWRWLETYYAKPRGAFGRLFSHKYKRKLEELWDPEGRKLIAGMDSAGIDVSVVLPLDFGVRFNEPKISIIEQHRLIAQVVSAYPSRMIGFVGVDPRRPDARDIIETGIEELGFKGIKLHPGTGFSLNNPEFSFIWEKAAEKKIPVLVHTGQAFGPLLSKYCRPTILDDILANYPDVRIVGAHLAGGWFDELCWMGYTKPNFYADISLWQIRCRMNKADFAGSIRKAIDMFGPDRLLFGTDWPFSNSVMESSEYVRSIKELGVSSETGSNFISAEIRCLLGKNAERLLQIR